jgi:hypothetical protein
MGDLIQRNQHFLHILIKRSGGELLIGLKELEDAKREKGAINVERLGSGVFKLSALKADGAKIDRPLDIDDQIQEEINKVEWPDEESNRQKAIEQNYIYEKLAGLVK